MKAKGIIDFMAKDLETVTPQCVITFRKQLKATLILGSEKEFTKEVTRVDDLVRFRKLLSEEYKNLPRAANGRRKIFYIHHCCGK